MWQSQNDTGGDGAPAGVGGAPMQDWFARLPGTALVGQELQVMQQLLPRLFGYHIVQIGMPAGQPYFRDSPISHRLQLQVEGQECVAEATLRCRTDALPLLAESMDVVLLPHTLEFSATPHKLLRECERILIEDGHLIIIGFNPWSLCGLWRLFLRWRGAPPWNGRFYSHNRIKDWLSLLDLELLRTTRCFYRPPLQRESFMRRLRFLEKLGAYCWSYFGGVHIMVARKRVVPLTPLKVRWRREPGVIGAGVAEPSARMRK